MGKHLLQRSFALALGLGTSLVALASPTTLTVGPASITAGAAPGTLNFPVTRTGDLNYDAYITYHTANGTALAGTDYTATNSVVRIPAGSASGMLPVPIAADPGGNTLSKTFQTIIDGAVGGEPTPSFAAQQTFAAGNSPRSVAAADVNGDGRLDLLVANTNSSNISVLISTTAPGATVPTFAAQVTFAAGTRPQSIAAADINGDGRPDLLVGNQTSNNVSVLLNTAAPGATTPSFTTQQTFPLAGNASAIAVADMNGDGRLDLLVANGAATVSVLLNTTAPGAAAPSFAAQQAFAPGNDPASVVASDLNGDGRPDLVVANITAATVSVLLNTTLPGATTVSFTPRQSFATGSFPRAAAADVNGDGRPDLLVANQFSSTVSVLLNTTAPGALAPSFAAQQTFVNVNSPVSLVASDLNGDGRLDLVLANQGGTVSVLFNSTAPGAASPSFAPQQNFAAGDLPSSVVAADLNGDGRPDLTIANQGNNVSVLFNTTPPSSAGPSFDTGTDFALGVTPLAVTTADFNGDGRLDLATANTNANTVSVLLNLTASGAVDASFAPPTNLAVDSNPSSVAAGDFNGDGRPDLVVANFNSDDVSVLLNLTSPGAASASFAARANFSVGASPYSVAVGDLNGDGRPDLAVTNTISDNVSVLLNLTAPGAASPSFAPAANFAADSLPYSVAIRDLNGDGRPDLAVANSSGNNVSVLLNLTAPGAASASFAAATNFNVGSAPQSVAVGDLNGDGRPDLAAVNEGDNTVSVLLNLTAPGAASASFAPAANFSVGAFPYSVAVGDLNGDGRPDLVTANAGARNVSLLLNLTTPGASGASFALAANYSAGATPSSVAISDLNGDGRPDLAVANENDDAVSVLLNFRLQASFAGSPATGTIEYTVADTTPTPFAFTPVTNATVSTPYTSAAILVTGLGAGVPAPISVTGGSYSIGCTASFVTAPGTIVNGQTVCVRQTSSAAFSTKTTATLSIGTESAGFDVTTMAIDNTLDPISFTPVTNAALSSVQTSNAVALTGINTGGGSISVSGNATARYCLNSNPCTSAAGSFVTGDTVRLQVTASANPATTVTATLLVGSTSADFKVTTRNPSTTPTPFSFSPVTDAAPGAVVQSNSIVVSGLEAAAAISITGDASARFCINSNACTAMVGALVNNGDLVKVQLTASNTASATVNTVLTIGSLSAGFSVTTAAGSNLVTPFFGVATLNAATDTTPVAGGSAGTYSFNARFCVNSGQYSQLFSQTSQLTNGNSLLNRTGDGPDVNQPGGVGSTLSFARSGQYADGVLSSGECLTVPYVIGLASRAPFSFRIDLRGAGN